jgi:hypothetical protein
MDNKAIYEEPRAILEGIAHELRDQDMGNMGTVYSRLRRLEHCLLALLDVCALQQRRIEELVEARQ